MSITVDIQDVKNIKTYTTDKSLIGIVITIVIAVVVLILAFFMNIVKWILLFIAVILFITVGVRIYRKVKEIKKQ
jgi:phosphatidylserine synthase